VLGFLYELLPLDPGPVTTDNLDAEGKQSDIFLFLCLSNQK